MARLRHPEEGCPWDLKQDHASLIPYTIEEAYEVADAIERGDFEDLAGELGDLLLQVVFHARLAEEKGRFDFEEVAAAICDKLTRRHPHVFAGVKFESDEERKRAWEEAKAQERREKVAGAGTGSVLSDVASTLPSLVYAEKIQNRAAGHGFDWPEAASVFEKVEEELDELREAFASGYQSHIQEEVGDLLFVIVNLARHLKVNPEIALKEGNKKFARRFRYIEEQVAAHGKSLKECELAELDALWREAKKNLPKPAGGG